MFVFGFKYWCGVEIGVNVYDQFGFGVIVSGVVQDGVDVCFGDMFDCVVLGLKVVQNGNGF